MTIWKKRYIWNNLSVLLLQVKSTKCANYWDLFMVSNNLSDNSIFGFIKQLYHFILKWLMKSIACMLRDPKINLWYYHFMWMTYYWLVTIRSMYKLSKNDYPLILIWKIWEKQHIFLEWRLKEIVPRRCQLYRKSITSEKYLKRLICNTVNSLILL
jgi:hypothetical protein